MIYRIILMFFFVLLSSCNSTKHLTIENENQQCEIILKPRLVFIDENLYADETEVTNFMYTKFRDWTAEIFGKNSNEFAQIQVNKSVWDSTETNCVGWYDYFDHPAYADYPIVGISLEQAELYSKWRTDRTAQLILTEKGLIKSGFIYSKDNYFTIDRYLNENYDWIIAKKEILVPEYKIPTKSEWELIAGLDSNYLNGIDLTTRFNNKTMNKYNYLNNTEEFNLGSYYTKKQYPCSPGVTGFVCSETFTFKVDKLGKNIYGLYGIIGNVSELISTNGISKGGNWKSRLTDYQIEKDLSFKSPNAWTGFRNIARQRLFKVNNKIVNKSYN